MLAASLQKQENPQEIENAIRQETQRFMGLWNSHAIAEHSQMLTVDADLVNVVGLRFHGRKAIQALHEQLHATIFAKSETRLVELTVAALGPTSALAHVHWEMSGAPKLPGWNVPEPRTGVLSLVWVDQGGEWKVRAMHNTDVIEVPALPKP